MKVRSLPRRVPPPSRPPAGVRRPASWPAVGLLLLSAAAADVVVTTVDGSLLRGDQVALEDGQIVVTRSAKEVGRAPPEAVIGLEMGRPVVEAGGAEARLVGADRLLGEIAGGNEETVRIATASFGEVPVLLDALRSLILLANYRELPEKPLLQAAGAQDVLLRRARAGVDQVHGTLVSIDAERIVMESPIGSLPFAHADAVALVLGGTERVEMPKTLLARATGTDGSRITGTLLSLDAGGLRLRTAWGAEIAARPDRVSRLEFLNGRFVYLSDLSPTEVKEHSFLPGLVWGWRRDQTTEGRPLTLQGTVHPRGLGTHAYCELAFALDGRPQEFTALAGVDDEVRMLRARGSVRFRVLVDGAVRWESDVLRGLEAPVRVPPIPLQGARELRLVTDFADDSSAGDRGDWAMAMLVRPPDR